MKQFLALVLFVLLSATQAQAQTVQDTVYFWKTGTLVLKQSIKTADLDSITFKRGAIVTPTPQATVVIGTQTWTTKNLDVTTYTDGTVIPQVTDPTAWAALKTGAWCYYNNDAANGDTYGKLYNWYAVAGIHDNDPSTPNKQLAPAGYHIPTDAEWTALTTFLGGESVAGGKMKATFLWNSPNTAATNSSGFTGLPSGGGSNYGSFNNLGNSGIWWCAPEFGNNFVGTRSLNYNDGNAIRNYYNGVFGFSIRCLAGEPVVAVAATVTTNTIFANGSNDLHTGGNVTNDGGAAVTVRGIVWSTNTNPTIALSTKTNDGAGTGTFTSSITGLTANTTYYFRAYATNSAGTSYGAEISFKTLPIPAVFPTLTTATTAITATTATTGGNITNDGGAAVTARGVVWSTTTNPTIALTTKTTDGTGTGTFASSLTGLVANTTYYVRAYATNSVGTSYGNEISFTTTTVVAPAGTVTIGTQVWTTKNLDLTTYTDGTVIPQVTDPTQWQNLKTGAWCYYGNNAANNGTYGKLYNWYAVAGIHDTDPSTPNKKLAPTGFHIPTDAEWTTLTTFLGGESVAGGKMKAATLWQAYSGITNTNSGGFTGLPGGYRSSGGGFDGLGYSSIWWSATENVSTSAWSRALNYYASNASRGHNYKEYGFSVRCVRDDAATVIVAPTITTTIATAIATTTATTGGNVTADGGATVTAIGVVWSTTTNPTIALTTKTTDGTGTGAFTSSITGLVANTTYYVRAYATNSVGTSYGNEVSFTTLPAVAAIETVTIGTQVWTTKNLDVSTYTDGTVIPQVTDPTAWQALKTGAWCYYSNDAANNATYGKLYNWYAVAGIHDTDPSTPNKKLAPAGYHIPTDAEWTVLTTFLGGQSVAGGKMKSTGTSLWVSPNTGASNSSGFTGLPGGFRYYWGSFTDRNYYGRWWSASENDSVSAWYRHLFFNYSLATGDHTNKEDGFSVRCVRD